MVNLEDTYDDLKGLFVDRLGIKTPTFKLIRDELLRIGRTIPPPTVSEVKDKIWALNSLLENTQPRESLVKLLDSRVFPVRFPDGSVKLCDAKTEFAIVDRGYLGDAFSAIVKTLDFSWDEVRRLDAFIWRLGLNKLFLSRIVREVSVLHGEQKIRAKAQGRSIRPKARALYR
jgi:hypothetical protein